MRGNNPNGGNVLNTHTHKKDHLIFNCMFGLIVCFFNIFAELMFLHCFSLQINLETTCLAVYLVLVNSS